MCPSQLFGKPKAPAEVKIPEPAPVPTPSDSATPQQTEQERKKRLERLRYGLASTVKTSSKGVTDKPELASGSYIGKRSLGE